MGLCWHRAGANKCVCDAHAASGKAEASLVSMTAGVIGADTNTINYDASTVSEEPKQSAKHTPTNTSRSFVGSRVQAVGNLVGWRIGGGESDGWGFGMGFAVFPPHTHLIIGQERRSKGSYRT